jgi:hypothetical protein
MKKLMIIAIAIIGIIFIANSNLKADIDHDKNPCINLVIVQWDAAWYYFCLGGTGTVCQIGIKICSPFDKIAAETILGRTLNTNETAILLSDTNGEFSDVNDLQAVEITEHTYQPNSPKIIGGSLNQILVVPAQTVVFSKQYNGFVGYGIFE